MPLEWATRALPRPAHRSGSSGESRRPLRIASAALQVSPRRGIAFGNGQPGGGAVEAAEHVLAGLGEIAVGKLLALGRHLRPAGEARMPLQGIAGQRQAEGGAEELQRALVAHAEEPQAAQRRRGKAEDDRPAHQPRLRRKRLRLIQTPASSSSSGAAQSSQVAGSSGGS